MGNRCLGFHMVRHLLCRSAQCYLLDRNPIVLCSRKLAITNFDDGDLLYQIRGRGYLGAPASCREHTHLQWVSEFLIRLLWRSVSFARPRGLEFLKSTH